MENSTALPVYQKVLSTGTLTVTPSGGEANLDVLFDVAERRNPKRSFLFVSKVLGRHIPISPAVMRAAYIQLADRLPSDLPQPVLFVGMAETAVGLAAGVHQEAAKRLEASLLLTSTRHPVDGDLLCEFKENHSHATDHLLYWPADPALRRRAAQARTLVLIDDEATTGNTFANLLAALTAAGLSRLERLVTVTLTDWSDNSLTERTALPVDSVSLARGSWHWQPTPDAPVPVMPAVNVTARGLAAIVGRQNWGRLGVTHSERRLGRHVTTAPGERLLVLGTSEFVWQPFLLAERLEQQGAQVRYGSTTRSPIALGHAIASVMAFTDNYGLGIPNFLYNVAHQRFDRVLVCTETPAAAIDADLLRQLRRVADAVEVIEYD